MDTISLEVGRIRLLPGLYAKNLLTTMSDSNDEDSICADTSSEGQNASHGENTRESSDEPDEAKFVDKETRYVFYLRLAVLLVLLVAAASLCTLVYVVSSGSETQSFQSNYEAAAEKVLDTFMDIKDSNLMVAGSLSVAITAHALAIKNEWPFVTLTAFQERASTVMNVANAIYVGINPVVPDELREDWEYYSNFHPDANWYSDGREYQRQQGIDDFDRRAQIATNDPNLDLSSRIATHIYDYDGQDSGIAKISPRDREYLPVWQSSPVTSRTMVNQNRMSNSLGARQCLQDQAVVFEGMQRSRPGYSDDLNPVTAEIAALLSVHHRRPMKYLGDIYSTVYFPIRNSFLSNRTTVGTMRVIIHWARFFEKIFPDSKQGVVVVLENGCDDPFTYRIEGGDVIPLGNGDLHELAFHKYEKSATFAGLTTLADGTAEGTSVRLSECPYSIRVYPSVSFQSEYLTKTPIMMTCAVGVVFTFTVFIFFVYDRLVERRQRLLMRKTVQTHKIVSSLFPKNIRDRLLEEAEDSDKHKKSAGLLAPNQRLKTFLNGDGKEDQSVIADLFPHSTVLFADICGFTAWSSTREPAQVFTLLETVYQAFDYIAKVRKVFKVETIGDSYVAVTGCPEPQVNHAIIMARFAAECMAKMSEVVRSLEISLGPDTAELTMRFGMNSGPVTAGVLRGDRSRFQLFGDTMNTAARMESTGVPGKIQATQATATLLIEAGKEHWVRLREDNVHAKGKGVLQTYWITPHTKKDASNTSSEAAKGSNHNADAVVIKATDTATKNLLRHESHIDWIVEMLQEWIRNIIAHRQARNIERQPIIMPKRQQDRIALDELVEVINLPDFDSTAAGIPNPSTIQINENIRGLLREYISIIASAYRDNPFHNFEHACHVTMSVSKFLKRIVTAEIEEDQLVGITDDIHLAKKIASHLHEYTHGINSDPITLFAIVFSAVIHDVDHRGVSNTQLMKEEPNMAQMFRNKSIAEQNSLELSWDLLVSDRFAPLRNFIFATGEEMLRFRQVVVNVVLATDIFDKELNDLRKARWEKAFAQQQANNTKEQNAMRATIVIEHIMQASDVCHTMQHWHIYRKWNKRLFFEMMEAFRAGRMGGTEPSTFWYNGELAFFDNYIIPLAKKLKDCNVFGVSSDECLNYAVLNRAEWKARGEAIVAEMMEEFHSSK